jgi:hypothetical protein
VAAPRSRTVRRPRHHAPLETSLENAYGRSPEEAAETIRLTTETTGTGAAMTGFVRAAREVRGQCTLMFADEAMNMSEITGLFS